jgi:hypothetical protein
MDDQKEEMTLRDHFAAAVITGIFAGKWGQMPSQKPEVAFADVAFLVADEMLRRRKQWTSSND